MDADIMVPVLAIVFSIGIPLSAIWTEHLRDRVLMQKGLYQLKQPSAYPSWRLLLASLAVTRRSLATS